MTLQIFVGDTSILSANASDSAASFNEVAVGATNAEAAGYRVFIDDVVIAHQHIGC